MAQQYEQEYFDIAEQMKMCCQLRFRDLIQETASEFGRMQNFCRIYPARNSKLYDKYFASNKQLNKVLYKVFYTSEILPYGRSSAEKSALPAPAKASDLQSIKSGVSQQERLHSSSGMRSQKGTNNN